MKAKNTFLVILVYIVLSGCSTIHYSHWDCTTYDPLQHTFEIDPAYIEKYGIEAAETGIKIRNADIWIVDSMPYFYFRIEKEKTATPIIPLFYSVDYYKKSALYNFQLSIGNNKIYKTLDSVSYKIYDSSETVYDKGGYNYNLNITETRRHELFKTPYVINLQLKETDIVYGDIELFFTDYNNQRVLQTVRKIKFIYEEGRYFTSVINS